MGIEIDPSQIDMVENGNFEAGGDSWDKTAGITFIAGKARYAGPVDATLWTDPAYLDLTIQDYRVKFDIGVLGTAEIRVALMGDFSIWYTTTGTKSVVLRPVPGQPKVLRFYFRNQAIGLWAEIDNVQVDRLGELPAFGYNLLPDPDGKFEVFSASEDRQWGRLASWKDKSRILFLYDPKED